MDCRWGGSTAQVKGKLTPLILGLFLVFLFTFLLYWNPPLIQKTSLFLDNAFYDLKLRYFYKPLDKKTPIAIIDIDDKSLAVEGRWPWSRKKLADLVSKLYELNATVVAIDILFAEPEKNLVNEVMEKLNTPSPELRNLEPLFNYDQIFANALEKGEAVLAFTLHRSGDSRGLLPPPILSLSNEEAEQLEIPNLPSSLSNIALLQQAAKGGGAINATPDPDGVIRSSPLLLRHGNGIYPSLALQAAMLYFLEDKPHLITKKYQNHLVLEGVQLDDAPIPLDPFGRILVPFRGPPYSFPYISATDLLQGRVSSEEISNKLLFIGSSATGMGDLFPTAIAPIFTGVEIHASIAAGILDHYFPYKPAWRKGVSLTLLFFLGILCAFCFPILGAIANTFLFFLLSGGLLAWDLWIWKQQAIDFSVVAPIFSLFILYLFNEIYGYSFETRKKKEIKAIFGQYISPDYLDTMLKAGKEFDLMGENKELSVLFSDIRGFTSLSEKLSAPEIKAFLNEYFTPMTQIIFDCKGTIDKYVGDMIMAFWGAPLNDPEHARHAIDAALAMQRKLQESKLEIKIGIGINTGMMNVGDMGSKFRRAYTVLGDTVNLASRLENLTKIYHVGIILGEETKKSTETIFLFKLLDKVQAKGKEKATEIYEPLCKREEASEKLLAEVTLHTQALQAYWQQEWDRASSLFQQLAPSNPPLYGIYQERIKAFRASPPPSSWNGVHILGEK